MVLRSCLYERRDGSKNRMLGGGGGGGGDKKKREKRLFSFLYRSDIRLLD